jgi:hypothetical protein
MKVVETISVVQTGQVQPRSVPGTPQNLEKPPFLMETKGDPGPQQ